MKKTKILALMLMAVPVLTFIGCSDDDDEGGGGSPQDDTSVIVTEDGDKLLLTSNGTSTFTYDDFGRCTSISYYGDGYNMSYNPFRITDTEGFYDIDVSFTKEGYISKFSMKYDYTDEYEHDKGSGSLSFSYSNGHLTKISVNGSGTYKDFEEGESYSYKRSGSTTFTWKDGNLMRTSSDYSGSEYDEKYSERYDSEYAYGTMENKHKQYVHYLLDYLSDALDDDVITDFAFIGMLGKASDYFPSSMSQKVVYKDGSETEENNYSYTMSYALNGNGTVRTETVNYGTSGSYRFNYAYKNLASSPSSAPMKVGVSGKDKAKTLRDLFKRTKR